ncbi:MAG: hypothetical protein AB7G34_12185 [Hyphomicrobiales bacterium]
MRSLIILPAFLASFAGAILVAIWALTADLGPATPHAALTGTAPESHRSVAVDEAQF